MVNFREISRGLVKGLLMFMHGLCILLAFCTLGFAIVDIRVLKTYGQHQAAGTASGDVIIMAASLLLITVAVIGTVGVVKENLKCLYAYIGMLMLVVVVEMLLAIFVALQRYGLQFRITEWIREDFFRNVTSDEKNMQIQRWDEMQTNYQCCGLNGPDDYLAIQRPISLSCCARASRAPTEFAQQQLYRVCIETASYYTTGCEDEILAILREDADWLLGAVVFSFWVEGAGMLLATWLTNNIKNSVHMYKDTVRY